MESYNVINVWDINLRNTLKMSKTMLSVELVDWKQMTLNQSIWKKIIYDDCKAFGVWWIKNYMLKQALQKQDLVSVL